MCATPIGNLDDCTFRLISTLKTVHLIAAEDTRVTQKLLAHFGIKTPLLSLQKFNETQRKHSLAEKLLAGQSIALVSDGGTPNIADPGAETVAFLREKGIPIVPIPGPSSVSTFISVAGQLANQFIFLGFLPKKPNDLLAAFKSAEPLGYPVVFFESPHRITKTLELLQTHFKDARLSLGKELTKHFETVLQTQNIAALSLPPAKGEWIGMLSFAPRVPDVAEAHAHLQALKTLGLSQKQLVYVGQHLLNLPKNSLYKLTLK
ncbi:MAG: 16S rRNA (cytidine(1402)-2'-O)-methyltransferase [Candidatus Margulisiibacteriota bacterium]